MASLFMNDKVLYKCTCGTLRPITRIYFCRHCCKIRCGDCVSHEVDSQYCPNCLEYMPSPEARLKKNRCATCFDCPSCMHTLSIRATTIQVPSPEDESKTVPKKVYYLACGFCRWTSRDVGISDQPIASGGWQEEENPNVSRINSLLEYYRVIAQREKYEKERRKSTQRCSYLQLSDKYSLNSAISRKLPSLCPPSLTKEEYSKSEELLLPMTTDAVEPLPESYVNEPLSLAKVCTIKQRLLQPEFQPTDTSHLFPLHKPLLVKRSQRCKECEHNLSKPEYNPSSIKFKIQLAAFYHIPEVRIRKIPHLIPYQKAKLEITLYNPTPHVAHVSFMPLDLESTVSTKVDLPECEFMLSARDDTAEFDDVGETDVYKDDPEIVSFRKSNKIGIYLPITPLKNEGDVKVSFQMKHNFVNTVVQLQADQREPQIIWLTHPILLSLGPVQQK